MALDKFISTLPKQESLNKNLDKVELFDEASRLIDWNSKEDLDLLSSTLQKSFMSGKSVDSALHDINNGNEQLTNNLTKQKSNFKDLIRQGEYVEAVKELFMILLGQRGGLGRFESFEQKGFVHISQEELSRINEQGKIPDNDEYKNLLQKQNNSTDPIKKMQINYLISQIFDFQVKKQIQDERGNDDEVDDYSLLSRQITPGSIILFRTNRLGSNSDDISHKIGDIALEATDSDDIDFTHAAVVSKDGENPEIIHSTMKEGVHSEGLIPYLKKFDACNVIVLHPNDPSTAGSLVSSSENILGMKYDSGAPVSQFLGGLSLGGFGDDPDKTNCVEFIADAVGLSDKSHPNDLLDAQQHGFKLHYTKTIVRDRHQTKEAYNRLSQKIV